MDDGMNLDEEISIIKSKIGKIESDITTMEKRFRKGVSVKRRKFSYKYLGLAVSATYLKGRLQTLENISKLNVPVNKEDVYYVG